MLLSSRLQPKETRQILLIGNSPSVLNNNFGNIIDSGKFIVCRFNFQPTDNFEDFIGSKTDYRIINGRTCKEYLTKRRKHLPAGKILVAEPTLGHSKSHHHYITQWYKSCRNDKERERRWGNMKVLRNNYRKDIKKNFFPSSGIISICHFLKYYSKIYIYGFSFNKDHFWHKNPEESKHHDYKTEKNFVDKMKKQGRIIELSSQECKI